MESCAGPGGVLDCLASRLCFERLPGLRAKRLAGWSGRQRMHVERPNLAAACTYGAAHGWQFQLALEVLHTRNSSTALSGDSSGLSGDLAGLSGMASVTVSRTPANPCCDMR